MAGVERFSTFDHVPGGVGNLGPPTAVFRSEYNAYFVEKYQTMGVLKMAHLPLTVEWFDSKKGPSKKADKSIPISEIYEIKRGHQTPTFWSFAASRGVSGMHMKEVRESA